LTSAINFASLSAFTHIIKSAIFTPK